ncbi:glycosyltransferase family 4 protein [Alkaliphilus serpentinus]|uniref:Undecaprenyl/decaprenyl-phosphate alpha-N-acetylglucosaminyl 1-phosphate transferase n=1 Tax=Alkaliphilus serpentinus TaxID=1482731 RepID=A0A833MED3_9FIRM|nr:MraY family glycosyltransferase [Alkaliphilus serpentinus]KAB3530889.1 undecaprenyl/decaprenyl-phosphate alpha-N-acetylglucosaminyl 1-phosphate transferase [Alkaliphilus serpentinus]
MDKLLISFFVAVAISYILTPYAKRFAYKVGAIDVPKDERRVHTVPIPRMGGLAIFLAFTITTLFMAELDKSLVGILIGATLIAIMGMLDDIKPISAKYKLLVQFIAAMIVIYSGVKIEYMSIPFVGEWVPLGKLSFFITVFWIIGITNTVNLIDGLDGLAAGVSVIASLTLAYVAYANNQPTVAMLLIILAGGAVGFLPYNFNPAQIFMGDTGSLLIGFLLATVSIQGVIKSATTIAVAIPVLALGVPVFDTAFAITRRLVNGRPIMEADKGHLHHRLLEQGLSQKQTVLVLYFISALLGGSAVFISDTSVTTAYLFLLTVAFVVIFGAFRFGLVTKSSHRKANM